MKKIRMPKNPHKGLKIYCNKCKSDNSNCNHFDMQQYRVRIHIPNTLNKVKVKIFETRDYDEAVKQAIDYKKELIANGYEVIKPTVEGNDYSLEGAIIKYNQYLGGNHPLAQKKKNVSKDHQDECIRFCLFFADVVKKRADVSQLRVVQVNKYDVSDFYKWAENHYGPNTFNKCMLAMKAFFNYLIIDEEVSMKNPFGSYVPKNVPASEKLTLTRNEFENIMNAVGIANPIQKLGGKGEKKNMYRPYLKDGFKIMLLTGGRREEVIELKWRDIYITIDGVKFFKVRNRKVEKGKKMTGVYKYIPINADLVNLMEDLGYSEKVNSDEFIFYPQRTETTKTLMNILSKAFTHYKKACNIEKNISMKNLRKTYISWVNSVLGRNTGLVTSHSDYQVIKDFYLDPTIISAIEKGALEIKVFGT